MFGYFYNEQFRRYIVAFGSLFDSIYVARHAGGTEVQRILVPIEFGPKERWLVRLTQDPTLEQGVGQIVPRFAYEYGAPAYDASRHLNTLNQLRFPSDIPGRTTRVWAGVPYNIPFQLSLLVKFKQDGFQVVEQILPYFTPDMMLAIQPIAGTGIVDTIPVTLNSAVETDNYEGDFEKRRVIIWTFDFTMKAIFYGPAKGAGVTQARIEQVQVDLFASTTFDLSEPPIYLATEARELLDNEDLTLLPDESTSNTYLETDPVERITVTADPLDQPDDGDISANTVFERLT